MKRGRPFITMGMTLMVTVLLVLLLVSFSLLSLSAARQDYARARDLAVQRQEYYAANNAAEEILHQLKTGAAPAGITESDTVISYSVPISGNRKLCVSLDAETLEILQWQTVTE